MKKGYFIRIFFILNFILQLQGCSITVNRYNCDKEKSRLMESRGIVLFNCSTEQNSQCNLSLLNLLKTENEFPEICR